MTKWEQWVSELPDLSNVAIPCCLREPGPRETHLHVFYDASKDAYVSAAYLVCRYSDNTASSRLIASKSRVSPIKAVTIPQLELMGAVFSSRLAKNIIKTLTIDRTTLWTDLIMYYIGSVTRAVNLSHLLPIGSAKSTGRQILNGGDTYLENLIQQTYQKGASRHQS